MPKTSMEKIAGIKEFLRKNSSPLKSAEQLRQESLAMAAAIPALPGVKIEPALVAGMNAEWVVAESVPKESQNVILYFHGGSFVSGSCLTFRDLASRLSAAGAARVLVFEYRLAPEYPYPAANEDCLAAYQWLLNSGIPARSILFGGDSVGGYLELMTLLALRDNTAPLPKAAFFLSPHTDFLYLDGESYEMKKQADPTNSLAAIRQCVENYFGEATRSPAVLSPLSADLTGLPPLFIQVGGDEIILSDSTRLHERAKAAGVQSTLEVWENMWHIFRFMAYMLPEGQEAVDHIGEFAKAQLDG